MMQINKATKTDQTILQKAQGIYVRPPRDLPTGNLRMVLEGYDPSLPSKTVLEHLTVRHSEK